MCFVRKSWIGSAHEIRSRIFGKGGGATPDQASLISFAICSGMRKMLLIAKAILKSRQPFSQKED
ncbi:MAG: hypothetical protein A2X49_04335 [Lentisphaerae bacterium GWF2_52_8]|nr:MAG: hypothetical protein A2X49_04335 [Lentisphaerae bacterium GWF2_52_8]